MTGHNLLYPGPQDRVRTRRRLTMVIARLERHVQLRPPGLSPRAFKCRDLRMVAASTRMPAFSNHRTVAHHDRSHQRVRRRGVTPVLCELAGALHETIANHSFLSPIRTLTVGTGLQLYSSLHRLNPKVCLIKGSRAVRGG